MATKENSDSELPGASEDVLATIKEEIKPLIKSRVNIKRAITRLTLERRRNLVQRTKYV